MSTAVVRQFTHCFPCPLLCDSNSQTPVRHLHLTKLSDEHIVRLQVAVHDPLRMGESNSVENAAEGVKQPIYGPRILPGW